MRAAKIIIGKYYKRAYRHVAMFWISALFSVSTFDQLESIMESIIAVTICENSSRFVKQHFENIKHCTDLDRNRVTAELINKIYLVYLVLLRKIFFMRQKVLMKS